jgi:hypothetical protein
MIKGVLFTFLYQKFLKFGLPIYFTSKEHYKLAKLVHSTVLKVIPPFMDLKEYFKDIINLLETYNLPIE